jgi:hypothetical protein
VQSNERYYKKIIEGRETTGKRMGLKVETLKRAVARCR